MGVMGCVYKEGAEGVRGQWHVMAPVRCESRDMTGNVQLYLSDENRKAVPTPDGRTGLNRTFPQIIHQRLDFFICKSPVFESPLAMLCDVEIN